MILDPVSWRMRSEDTNLRRAMERVGVENGLDHDEWLREVLPHKVVSVVGRLVRTVVEHLQERRSPQMEHKLKAKDCGEKG